MNILGPQLNTDPRFNAATGWSNIGPGYAWDIDGDGAAVQRGTEEPGTSTRAFAATQDGERAFLVIIHIDAGTSGNVKALVIPSGSGTTRTAPGTYAEIMTITDASGCQLWTSNNGDLRVTLFEIFEVIAV